MIFPKPIEPYLDFSLEMTAKRLQLSQHHPFVRALTKIEPLSPTDYINCGWYHVGTTPVLLGFLRFLMARADVIRIISYAELQNISEYKLNEFKRGDVLVVTDVYDTNPLGGHNRGLDKLKTVISSRAFTRGAKLTITQGKNVLKDHTITSQMMLYSPMSERKLTAFYKAFNEEFKKYVEGGR